MKQSIPAEGSQSERSAPLLLREMEFEDLQKVYELGEQLFTADEWPTLYRTWDPYELVRLFASDGETCLVAEIDDRLVGFVLGTVIDKRASSWRYGYVVWIGVDPEVKRRGVATRLLEELTGIFVEMKVRMLLVDTEGDNEPAIRFFQRAGFGSPVSHVYMSRNLTHSREYRQHRRALKEEEARLRARRRNGKARSRRSSALERGEVEEREPKARKRKPGKKKAGKKKPGKRTKKKAGKKHAGEKKPDRKKPGKKRAGGKVARKKGADKGRTLGGKAGKAHKGSKARKATRVRKRGKA